MPREEDHYDWLNDPFDEEKSKKEMEEAKRVGGRGALISIVAIVVAFLVMLFLFMSCAGMALAGA